jgi:heme exporter protein B
MINSQDNLQEFGIIFSVVCVPLAFIGLSAYLIKPDIEDGHFEFLLVTYSLGQIITAKYFILCCSATLSFLLSIPLTYLLFNLSLTITIKILICGFLLITISASLICLISAIQSYFRTNTNFLSVLVMPLIIPSIILSGITLQQPDSLGIMLIMCGINFVIIPSGLYLSGFLIENIYNI